MDRDFHMIEDLNEPLLNEKKMSDHEIKRMRIMQKRGQKKMNINNIDQEGKPRALSNIDMHKEPNNRRNMNGGNAYSHFKMRSDILPYLTSPHSPVAKVAKALISPVHYIRRQIRPGGIKGSIFNLVCGVLGTGMLTLPVVCLLNGIVMGTALIIAGVLLTVFCGMCIVICSEATNTDSLELIAEVAFGETIGKLTSYSTVM